MMGSRGAWGDRNARPCGQRERAFLTSEQMAARGMPQEQVNDKVQREQVAAEFSSFLTNEKINREELREKLQKAAIVSLMDSIKTGHQNDIRENMRVLADLSGIKATRIQVEAPKGLSDAQLAEFRNAGRMDAAPSVPQIEASTEGSDDAT